MVEFLCRDVLEQFRIPYHIGATLLTWLLQACYKKYAPNTAKAAFTVHSYKEW